jgi:hypothetical protein
MSRCTGLSAVFAFRFYIIFGFFYIYTQLFVLYTRSSVLRNCSFSTHDRPFYNGASTAECIRRGGTVPDMPAVASLSVILPYATALSVVHPRILRR